MRVSIASPAVRCCRAIGGDRQARRIGIARLAQLVPPPPDALDGEGRGIGINADADSAMVGRNVVDAIGGNLAEFRDLEIMHPNLLGVATRGRCL